MTWENYKKGYEKEARNVLFLSIIHYCNFLFIKAKTTQWVNIRMRRNELPIITVSTWHFSNTSCIYKDKDKGINIMYKTQKFYDTHY